MEIGIENPKPTKETVFPGEITEFYGETENDAMIQANHLPKFNLTILEVETSENNFKNNERKITGNQIEKFEFDLYHDYNKNSNKSRYNFSQI